MFYVTIIRGARVGYLLGPFEHHEQAIAQVKFARDWTCDLDPFACFDAFGTCRVTAAPYPVAALTR